MSHHATEDLSIMRALPGMIVCAPGSAYESSKAVDALVAHDGPGYLRLERAAADFSDDSGSAFRLGTARVLRQGAALTIVACGGVVAEAMAAAEVLQGRGVGCRVLSMHTVKPLDRSALEAAARETGGIVTVEENSVLGGLGGAVAEVCLEADVRPKRFRRIGIRDTFVSEVGDQAFLRGRIGLDHLGIADAVAQVVYS